MPFHGSSQVPLNCTFDVSGIPVSNVGNAQDAATIVAEVSAAAVVHRHPRSSGTCRNPKLPSCMAGIQLMHGARTFGPGASRCTG